MAGITAYADGPEEMSQAVTRHTIGIGADQIKLSMSGEEVLSLTCFQVVSKRSSHPSKEPSKELTHPQIPEIRSAQDCDFTDEETAAGAKTTHSFNKRLCANARACDSVKIYIRHGVDVIFHASYVDEEGMEIVQKNKHKHVEALDINWLIATCG